MKPFYATFKTANGKSCKTGRHATAKAVQASAERSGAVWGEVWETCEVPGFGAAGFHSAGFHRVTFGNKPAKVNTGKA